MATWRAGLTLPPKDPYAEDDYLFEWTDWLNGASIAAHTVTGTNITVASSSVVNGGQDVICRLTGGTAGDTATVACRVTTDDASPRKDERSVQFIIQEL